MPQTIKSKGGSTAHREGQANGASDKKARGKYALDAGALLDGILNETQSEAAAEEEKLRREIQAKQSEEQRKALQDAEMRRRQAEAALAAERERQESAKYRREAVLRTMQDLEAERESGSLTPTGMESVAPEPQHRPVEFEHAGSPISQSYSHRAVPSRRSPWLMVAMVAALVIMLGGGATAFFLITSQPAMDPASYPKVTPDLATVTRNSLVIVGLAEIPRPEPEPIIVQVPVPVEDTGATAERERSGRRRDRDRNRDNEEETTTQQNAPLDLSLDSSGIFDRGSE